MKKIITIFIIFSSISFYISACHNSPRPFYWPHPARTPRNRCQLGMVDDTPSGFGPAYRKEKGDQYLQEMIKKKKEEKEKMLTARRAKNEAKEAELSPRQQPTVLRFPIPVESSLSARRNNPSFVHLRTARSAEEIRSLLIIQSMLPAIHHPPQQMTRFDIQPEFYRIK
jgi:hypothetical protein